MPPETSPNPSTPFMLTAAPLVSARKSPQRIRAEPKEKSSCPLPSSRIVREPKSSVDPLATLTGSVITHGSADAGQMSSETSALITARAAGAEASDRNSTQQRAAATPALRSGGPWSEELPGSSRRLRGLDSLLSIVGQRDRRESALVSEAAVYARMGCTVTELPALPPRPRGCRGTPLRRRRTPRGGRHGPNDLRRRWSPPTTQGNGPARPRYRPR
jgi:hypothetical protein